MTTAELHAAIAAVRAAIDATETDWAELPFFVRPMVRRGFVQRTGHDVGAWRGLLADVARGADPRGFVPALDALIANWRGAPERAQKGMGGTPAQVAVIEERVRPRIEAALALRALIAPASS